MEMERLAREDEVEGMVLRRMNQEEGLANGAGHQSEPTTPPEYRDSGFPSGLSRPNRYSTSNVLSSAGIAPRKRVGGSSMASAPNERDQAYHTLTGGQRKSLPQSKHTSDVEDGFEEIVDRDHRSAAS